MRQLQDFYNHHLLTQQRGSSRNDIDDEVRESGKEDKEQATTR